MRDFVVSLGLLASLATGCGKQETPEVAPPAGDCDARLGELGDDALSKHARRLQTTCQGDAAGIRCDATRWLTREAAICLAQKQGFEAEKWWGGLVYHREIHGPIWRMHSSLEEARTEGIPHAHVLIDAQTGQAVELLALKTPETQAVVLTGETMREPMEHVSGTLVLEAGEVRGFSATAAHGGGGLTSHRIAKAAGGDAAFEIEAEIDVRGEVETVQFPAEIVDDQDAITITAVAPLSGRRVEITLVAEREPA